MTSDGVSVITVVRNDRPGLRTTAESVLAQSFRPMEWLIIDGASTDGTADDAQSFQNVSEIRVSVVSEPDRGIYDAMNRGLSMAKFPWVIFMNAGDRFVGPESLDEAASLFRDGVDVVYSDVVFERDGRNERINCDWHKRRFHHQAIIYRRNLHNHHGRYLVAPGVTISDYVFLNQLTNERWIKHGVPLAVCDATGQSSRPQAYYQKLATDLIFGHKNRSLVAVMLLLYPIYHRLIKPIRRYCGV
jgi:glycosyltransferase involved in cell wall biosynthesis